MITISEFSLEVIAVQMVRLPADAVILDAQFRVGRLVLWAQLDTAAPVVDRYIYVYRAGTELFSPPGRHIATVQQFNGGEAWHVYEASAA